MYLLAISIFVTYLCVVCLSLTLITHFYEADANLVAYTENRYISFIPGINFIFVIYHLVTYFRFHQMVLTKNPVYLKRMRYNKTADEPRFTKQEHRIHTIAAIDSLFEQCTDMAAAWVPYKALIDQNMNLTYKRIGIDIILTNLVKLNETKLNKETTIEDLVHLQTRLTNLRARMLRFKDLFIKTTYTH